MISKYEVEQLHRLLGGDPVLEGHVLEFIKKKYGAKNLTMLSHRVFAEIVRRPNDFLKEVKRFAREGLPF